MKQKKKVGSLTRRGQTPHTDAMTKGANRWDRLKVTMNKDDKKKKRGGKGEKRDEKKNVTQTGKDGISSVGFGSKRSSGEKKCNNQFDWVKGRKRENRRGNLFQGEEGDL